MSKRKLKTNEKAIEARARKEQVKNEKERQAEKEAEDAKWTDEGSTAKERRLREKANKSAEKEAAIAKKKALIAEEEAIMASLKMNSKSKQELRKMGESTKVTQHQMLVMKEKEAMDKEKQAEFNKLRDENIFVNDPLAFENTNRMHDETIAEDEERYGKGNVHHARDIDSAIKSLNIYSISGADLVKDRHPEKRVKAAWKAFEADRLPELKMDYPELKLSQLKERLRKEWEKSDRNPLNNTDE